MKKLDILVLMIVLLGFTATCLGEEALTITYGSAYKPFAWGEDITPHGVQPDFVEEILGKRMGIKVKHEAYPWKRCQYLVKSGQKDGFFTVPTPERAEYTITCKIPFYETHFVMHTAKNNPNVERLRTVRSLKDLEEMEDIRHVYMLGSGWHENVLKNMKNVSTTPDASVIPLMLIYLRADVYIEQAEMLRYQAKEKGVLDKILTLYEPSIRTLGWHIFISKKSKYQSLIPKIDDMLAKLKESGELERIKLEIFNKYGIE